jgi:hypothetical protein
MRSKRNKIQQTRNARKTFRAQKIKQTQYSPQAKKGECQHDHYLIKEGCKIPAYFPQCDCNHLIEINLAGLTGNLNFLLLKFEGNDVEIDTILGDEIKKERGKIYNVGIDFIELKTENGMIVSILKDKIGQIRWLKDECPS